MEIVSMNIKQIRKVNRYDALVKFLIERREINDMNQTELSNKLRMTQSWISKVESQEIRLDIDILYKYSEALGVTLELALKTAGYLSSDDNQKPMKSNIDNTIIPIVSKSHSTSQSLSLCLQHDGLDYFVKIDGIDIAGYKKLDEKLNTLFLRASSDSKFKNRDAIAEGLEYAVTKFPLANPSDLYHHLVYRTYLRDYSASNPKQSWARAGGEAIELLIKKVYAARLWEEGILVQIAFEKDVSKNMFLKDMRIEDKVSGQSKLDIGLYGLIDDELVIFGGIHSKASLAERVSDDIPCSVSMIEAGFYSYLFTFDAKSFPPPHGNLINKGELGSIDNPSDKRKYVEDYGQFSACFSFNHRTAESGKTTKSGKKIIVPLSMNCEDLMSAQIISDWREFKSKHKTR
jgi:hypothetical protein